MPWMRWDYIPNEFVYLQMVASDVSVGANRLSFFLKFSTLVNTDSSKNLAFSSLFTANIPSMIHLFVTSWPTPRTHDVTE